MFRRELFKTIKKRLAEPRKFIQVLSGPRQVGKTTLAQQIIKDTKEEVRYASADSVNPQNQIWIEQQWETARLTAAKQKTLLILDEIQKIHNWSEIVKKLWDEDTRKELSLKVLLLGSSPLLIQNGLTESLAGRFELIYVPHWSFAEMQQAFDWSLEQYVFFGGYPGAASLIKTPERWSRYICDSLIETTISRDILLLNQINKPALLRQLFQLGCLYSSQILSYQKMLGQLQDAGNTTTLAHYLNLLEGVGMVAGIGKFGNEIKKRASSPKLQVLNTALISSQKNLSFKEAQENRDYWGRLVESTIGAHLLNSSKGKNIEVYYWRERGKEVDFVLKQNSTVVAIEVKSGHKTTALPGMQAFKDAFNPKRSLLVGEQGISIADFLQKPIEYWV